MLTIVCRGTPVNHSALLIAILENQNCLQETWDNFYRDHGLGALAFLPESYQTATSPETIVCEYWTAERIKLYLMKDGGLSAVGQRWMSALPREVQKGFATVIISNNGDPSVEDAHFYRIGGKSFQ
jgi:hypothetical protein